MLALLAAAVSSLGALEVKIHRRVRYEQATKGLHAGLRAAQRRAAIEPALHFHFLSRLPSAILKFLGRGAAAISSRRAVPKSFGSPVTGAGSFPPKPARLALAVRLGGQGQYLSTVIRISRRGGSAIRE